MSRPAPHPASDRDVLLFVVDSVSGEPIADATVHHRVGSFEELLEEGPSLRTDSRGVVSLRCPSTAMVWIAGVTAANYAPRFVHFDPYRGESIPDSYTLRLTKVDRPVGGRVQDSDGRPIEGVELEVRFLSGESHSHREPAREGVGTFSMGGTPLARTDADGRWTSTSIPREHPGFSIRAFHPEFVPAKVVEFGPGTLSAAEGVDAETALREGRLSTILARGVSVEGFVLDADGGPVADAELVHAPLSDQERRIRSSPDGSFRWPHVPEGPFSFVATAKGHAPVQERIDARPDLGPVRVRLGRTASLRLRVVDPDGHAIPGVRAVAEGWDGAGFFWIGKTDADGRAEWKDAPEGETVRMSLLLPGSTDARERSSVADGLEHEIVVPPPVTIRGRVTDAASGLPLAAFRAIEGDPGGWRRGETRHGRDGVLVLTLGRSEPPFRVRVEAEGYLPVVLEDLAEWPPVLEVPMTRADASRAVHGLVLDPAGNPAPGVRVDRMPSKNAIVRLARRTLAARETSAHATLTAADGRFRMPPESEGDLVVAVGESGIASARIVDPTRSPTIHLQAWGRLEGTVDRGLLGPEAPSVWIQPAGNLEITWLPDPPWVTPDTEGRFAFEALPPGEAFVELRAKGTNEGRHARRIHILPGSTTDVRIGDDGPRVRGRLHLVAPAGGASDPAGLLVSLASRDLPSPVSMRTVLEASTDEEKRAAQAEIRRVAGLRRTIVVADVDADGRFATLEGLPPGAYVLGIHRAGFQGMISSTRNGPRSISSDDLVAPLRRHLARTGLPDVEIPFTVPESNPHAPRKDFHDLGDLEVRWP
ncbi:MAG: carboxypeptidase regulatory-like domain-containing protein [Verrucomicrobiales bacterium]|nr:carboxypeptidase regulatory-like domain-containing protein [Verrucomicrobiales bacterium]